MSYLPVPPGVQVSPGYGPRPPRRRRPRRRGPGVTPPFPAPPVEGRSTRLWLGLGAAGLAVLLCCGGGLAAGIGLAVTGSQAVTERARAAVGDYLDDVRAERYSDAYESLCPALRQRESSGQFTDRVADEPEISGYEFRDVELGTGRIILPVDVRYDGGNGDTLRFKVEQNASTGEFEVCGIDG